MFQYDELIAAGFTGFETVKQYNPTTNKTMTREETVLTYLREHDKTSLFNLFTFKDKILI